MAIAFYNRGQHLNIRDFTSINSVPALKLKGYGTVVTLLDSEFKGGAKDAIAFDAVSTDKKHGKVYPPIFVRNLKTSGYGCRHCQWYDHG